MSKDKTIPEGQVKAVRRASTDQDSSRKSLKTLQHVATDKENLTGRPVKLVGKEAIKEVTIEIQDKVVDTKNKKLVNKEKCVQTGVLDEITAEDLTSDAGPSENYWQVLAEKRRLALEDVLRENKELHEKIAKLEEENRICKDMLDETKNMVEVLSEMIGEQEESGIDLREASTFSVTEDANETTADSINVTTDDS